MYLEFGRPNFWRLENWECIFNSVTWPLSLIACSVTFGRVHTDAHAHIYAHNTRLFQSSRTGAHTHAPASFSRQPNVCACVCACVFKSSRVGASYARVPVFAPVCIRTSRPCVRVGLHGRTSHTRPLRMDRLGFCPFAKWFNINSLAIITFFVTIFVSLKPNKHGAFKAV